jgi:hypothetical protein
MHRTLLIALLALAVGGGAAAYALGRGLRSEPPVPDTRAKVIKVAAIQVARWDLTGVKPPRLAPPDPTPVPQTTDPDVSATVAPPATTDTDTSTSQPAPVVTSAPVVPTTAPAATTAPQPEQPAPQPTIGGGTGGDP